MVSGVRVVGAERLSAVDDSQPLSFRSVCDLRLQGLVQEAVNLRADLRTVRLECEVPRVVEVDDVVDAALRVLVRRRP
jgi:hypothetical protein